MAYERKSLQILGGGFNLLPPGDKVPKADYLLAQNWRVDREGRLVSRYGYPLKFSLTGPAFAHSAAIFGGVEGDWYIAANALLGANPGAIYHNFGATPIVAGLSGRRVGFAPLNGWMWIMDRLVQGRHNGASGYLSWGLDAPATGCTAAAGGAGGPNGSYEFYCTFLTADNSVESNPGPASNTVTVANQDVAFSGIPVSSDPQMAGGTVNVYGIGGTLGSGGSGKAYLVASVPNGTTTATWHTTDLAVTNDGIFMPTDHDPPPPGRGLAGPHYSRLFTWLGNRLFYTEPNQPQYWPGSSDPAIGNWVDVGMEGEVIVWCTVKTNVLLIYKERSLWRLVGDPSTGTLEIVEEGVGLVSAFALVSAGQVDYFVAPNGLREANTDGTRDMSGEIRPLFQTGTINNGPLTQPGGILPGPDYLATSLDAYGVVLGYAMGKLYVSYSEIVSVGAASVLLVYHEQEQRWGYHRDLLDTLGFQGFLFDGVNMIGLTGTGGGTGGGDLTQIGLSVPGTIAVSTNAAPLVSLAVDAQATVIAALLKAPSIGGPVTVKVWAGATLLGTVTIWEGATVATTPGTMASVSADTPITLSITGVGSIFPGGDLSVEVWFYTGAGGGSGANVSMGYNIDDFRAFYAQDEPTTEIECVYQSHFEDCGLPENLKCWLEVVVDCELATGDTATVYEAHSNGALASLGTIAGNARLSKGFALSPSTLGLWAKNLSVAVDVPANHPVAIHNVYLYYYVGPRLAAVVDSSPTDLGSELLKLFKKLEFDIQCTGDATLTVYTDQPAGALGTAEYTETINTGGVRKRVKVTLPPGVRGRLFWVRITGTDVALWSGRVWWRAVNTMKQEGLVVVHGARWGWGDIPFEVQG